MTVQRQPGEHPLGTDLLGRDYMSRLFYGARISLLIGFAAMLISGVIGTTLGVLAGYFGGRIDMVRDLHHHHEAFDARRACGVGGLSVLLAPR